MNQKKYVGESEGKHPGNFQISPASFRDPSGVVYSQDGVIYRQINPVYQEHYDKLISSGLYAKLLEHGLIIPHSEVTNKPLEGTGAYKVIQPEPLDFITYPYEWCFNQLKDAALTTLSIQQIAIDHGMQLKDASAYNIQFYHGRTVLIDTLSFEVSSLNKPWVAYRQFCQHFLAPLSLMAKRDFRLGQLLRVYIDGIPLDLASYLLPKSTRLDFTLLTHIHLHASSQKHYAKRKIDANRQISSLSLRGLIDNLKSGIEKLKWIPQGIGWDKYYQENNYTTRGLSHKEAILDDWIERIGPATVWDLGANTGLFSRLASRRGIPTLAFDIDPAAVELNYRQCIAEKDKYLLPALIDLTNPSPGLGWMNQERYSLLQRTPVDAIFALALIHHLAISNNLPFDRLVPFFRSLGKWLFIEFIPKEDNQVERLLANRQDIFSNYNQTSFEKSFLTAYEIQARQTIQDSCRQLYLMKARDL
jgi:hypothetical protein